MKSVGDRAACGFHRGLPFSPWGTISIIWTRGSRSGRERNYITAVARQQEIDSRVPESWKFKAGKIVAPVSIARSDGTSKQTNNTCESTASVLMLDHAISSCTRTSHQRHRHRQQTPPRRDGEPGGKSFECPWPRFSKMEAAVKAKTESFSTVLQIAMAKRINGTT